MKRFLKPLLSRPEMKILMSNTQIPNEIKMQCNKCDKVFTTVGIKRMVESSKLKGYKNIYVQCPFCEVTNILPVEVS